MKRCFGFFILALLLSSTAIGKDFPLVSELPFHEELPDPLVMFDGKPVESKKDWLKKRRPELKELFQRYEYGYFPPAEKIKTSIDHVDKNFYGGQATLKLATISFKESNAPRLHLMLVVPNERKKPAPVFLGLNFSGNHSLVSDAHVPVPFGWMSSKYPGVINNHATEAGRGKLTEVWSIEQSIDRGYAVATIFAGEIQQDVKVVTNGVRSVFRGSKNSEEDWGTIAAWAWGLHRAVDFLEQEKTIGKKKIMVVGHSRLGKAAMLAGAFDERIAMVIPLQAGCGGTSPCRGKIGQSVAAINKSFPHWFCDEFKKFGEQPERLPFDQHCLIALCAPRPVLLSNAVEDEWANPAGQFEMLKAADKVYRQFGKDGVGSQEMPEVGQLMDSSLGYFIRAGKHSMTKEDWKVFLDFADKHFGKPQ